MPSPQPPAPVVMTSTTHVRWFSDRLMGYSPMAPTGPAVSQPPGTSTTPSSIPTAQDVTTAGGVWAPTSAKRDKITELKAELVEVADKVKPTGPFPATLDDLATPLQKLDLWLVDGLDSIARKADVETLVEDTTATDDDLIYVQIKEWMTSLYKEKDDLLTQHQCEDYLRRFQREMERHLAWQVTKHGETPILRDVRDYMDISGPMQLLENPPSEPLLNSTPPNLSVAVRRYRLLLAQAASQVLLDNWKSITTVSSHDIDRAAVDGITLEAQDATLPLVKVEALLESYLLGNAATRVEAWWDLIDRDHDGLLQESEMNSVCELTVKPVGQALQKLLQEAIQAHPVTLPPSADANVPVPSSWRQRRREAKAQRQLTKMFAKTVKNHFQDEVEMAHRLRCIYQWANKSHQDNAIKSVLVDEIAWTGRKRYVELPPKISLAEFREVQREHFTHLDRVASEYLKSFREDLWIIQGKGRQRAELYRDCALFMAAVCGVDYVILSL